MFCRFCGTQLNENVAFCNQCGAQIQKSEKKDIKYSNLPFGQEMKKSIFLLAVAVVYLLWVLIFRDFFQSSFIYEIHSKYGGNAAEIYGVIVNLANFFIVAMYYGALAYMATKRSFKLLLIYLAPYYFVWFFFFVKYHYYETAFESFRSIINYFGGFFIPIIVIGVLRIVCISMSKVKSKALFGVVSTLVTVILISIYIVLLLSSMGMGYFDNAKQYLIFSVSVYALGIAVTNLLLHLIYKGK